MKDNNIIIAENVNVFNEEKLKNTECRMVNGNRSFKATVTVTDSGEVIITPFQKQPQRHRERLVTTLNGHLDETQQRLKLSMSVPKRCGAYRVINGINEQMNDICDAVEDFFSIDN